VLCFPVLLLAWVAQPATAQFRDIFKKGSEKVKKASETFTPWTADQEQAIGSAAAAKVIHIFGLYDNADMMKYVNLVGNTLARQGTRQMPYHFGILDSEAVTAFGMPGGYVFITRGALANMRSEAQLAGTLAHEVAHVDNRHLEKEVRSKKARSWAMEEGSSKIPAPAELKNIANDIVANALTLRVSRDKEDEADRVGTDIAQKAGYDPAGLRDFLQVLAKAAESEQNKQQLGLWGTTHPPFNERVASLTKVLEKYSPGGQVLESRYQKNVVFDKTKASGTAAAAAQPTTPEPASEETPAQSGVAKSGPASKSKTVSAKTNASVKGGGKTAASAKSGGKEVDGVVSKGVVVLIGAELAEGSRVKVKDPAAPGQEPNGIVSKGVVVITSGKLAEGARVKVIPE
jgi:predicted Zn-dependent protease